MRLSEQEFIDLMAKKKVVRLILPFRLPTWNQLLAMHHWQRKKVRDWIKAAVYMCITKQKDLRTVTDARLKPVLTALSLQDYYKMIVPSSSRKLASRKKSQR